MEDEVLLALNPDKRMVWYFVGLQSRSKPRCGQPAHQPTTREVKKAEANPGRLLLKTWPEHENDKGWTSLCMGGTLSTD